MRELFKARRVADELIGYFLRHHVYNLQMKLDVTEKWTRVNIEGILTEELDDIEEVISMMNIRRVPELEEYYDNLLGADYGGNDMHLLGAMVDKASFEFDGEKVRMQVIRYTNNG